MESWFTEAKRISSLDAEVCFLLHEDFYFGPDSFPQVTERKEVELLPSPAIQRHVPSMVRTSEAIGHENELADYYHAVLRVAASHQKTFNEIRQYFWLRFSLWNTEQQIHISFPWYDTYSEIDRFLTGVSGNSDGQVFWDADQGWELEFHASDGELFGRLRNPDDDETHAIVRLPTAALLSRIQPLRTRTESIIQTLSSAIGRDLWTNHVEWPEFCSPTISVPTDRQPWWQRWKGRTKP
jgi:hypothetical protein